MVLIDADCNCRVDSDGPNPIPLLEASILLPPSQVINAGQFPAAAHWGTDGVVTDLGKRRYRLRTFCREFPRLASENTSGAAATYN